MIHFLYLVGFALFVALVFAAIAEGTSRDRVIYGVKTFFPVCRYQSCARLDTIFHPVERVAEV